MSRAWALLAVLLAPLASAGVTILHSESSGTFAPVAVDVLFGRIVAGTTLNADLTEASVSISGTLLQTTTHILYLNNTSTTTASYARLEVVSTTGLASLDVLRIGIDNGVATDQIVIQLGTIIDADGTYVRLEPASTNTIYTTQSLSTITTATVAFAVYAADDAQESAYVKTHGSLTLA